MHTGITISKENKALDAFKFIACIFVAGSHITPLFESEVCNLYYKQWLFRFCVPFFFVSSGYFFFKTKEKGSALKRIALLYALGCVLYLPEIIGYAGDFHSIVSVMRWNLVFGYEHLWYLCATLEGMLIWYLAEKIPLLSKLFQKFGLPVAVVLLLLGALLDEYYPLFDNGVINYAAEFLSRFGGPRNVVFFGFPMLMIGGGIARYENAIQKIPTWLIAVALPVSWALSFAECSFLFDKVGTDISADITFFNFWPAIFLFLISFRIRLNIPDSFAKALRKMAEYVYILHPLAAAYIGMHTNLSRLSLWAATVLLCSAGYILLEKQFVSKKQ